MTGGFLWVAPVRGERRRTRWLRTLRNLIRYRTANPSMEQMGWVQLGYLTEDEPS